MFRFALTLLLLRLSSHAHAQCPAQCSECSLGAQSEYRCAMGGAHVWIDAVSGQYVRLQCDEDEGDFTCSDFPELNVGAGRDIEMEMKSCALPGAGGLQCAATTRMGATGVTKLMMRAARAHVRADHLRGLDRLVTLTVYWDGDDDNVTSFPRAALGALPSLQNFTLNGGRLALRPGDLRLSPNLVHLELSQDRIQRLPPGLLANLTKLRTLLLWSNDIEELDEEAFNGVPSLEVLSLSSNRLTSFPVTSRLPRLRELSLYKNRLETLLPLREFKNLEELQLFDNQVPLKIAPGALSGLSNLKTAELQRNDITELAADTFKGSYSLQRVDLSGNQLQELPARVFEDLKRLRTLDLSDNKLKTLLADTFQTLGELRVLKLDHNELETLPSGLLLGLGRLVSFVCAHNALRVISHDALGGARALTHIDLSHNKLTFDEPEEQLYSVNLVSPLNALSSPHLSWVSLSHNRLRAPPPDAPALLLHLTSLNLSHNQIEHLTYYDVSYLKDSDLTVDFSYNNISVVYLQPAKALPSGGLGTATATAVLRGNPLDCDCRLYQLAIRIKGARVLNELAFDVQDTYCDKPGPLHGRPIADLSLDEFQCQLPEANCSDNCNCSLRPHRALLEMTCLREPASYLNRTVLEDFLYTVGAESVPGLSLKLQTAPTELRLSEDLTVVNVSGLGLSSPPVILPGGALRLMDLSDNALRAPPLELLEQHENISVLLAENPLICSCKYATQLAELKKLKDRIADYVAVTCEGGVPLDSINTEQLCSAVLGAVFGGVLALVGGVLAAAAAVGARYSLEIRVLLYRCRWLRRWFPEDDRDADRKYDAFVSFAHEDEDFVVEQLLPGLEGTDGGFKLCVHYRDWVAGEWIPAQIASSVEQSRRTIVVLSKHFLESKWGRLEFRAANMAAVKEKTTRVIVVLLEDVSSHEEVDAEMKAYLNTNTYLEWGDPWFWDKLRYALPHRRGERRAREKGDALAHHVALEGVRGDISKEKGGGIDARLTRDGKIINMAAITATPAGTPAQ